MHPPSSKGLSIFSCALLHGLNHAFQLLLPPLYLSIRNNFRLTGLSPVMLFSTIYFVVYAAMSLPYGFLGDRFSKKKVLIFGAALNSIAFLVAATTQSYTAFMAAMVLAGLGGGAYHPVANALISNLFKGALGRAFGLIGMGASFGLFAGPVLSGFIGEQFGWRMSCLAFAVFGCIVAAFSVLIIPEEPAVQSRKEESNITLTALVAPLLPVILVLGLRDFCLWGTVYLTPAMTQMNMDFSKKLAGTLIGIMSLTGVISQPLAGMMSDRFGRRRVVFIALIISCLMVSIFPYLNRIYIFAVAVVSGFMLLGTVPVMDAVCAEIIPPSLRGRLFGVMMTLGLMIGALSPYCMGLIHDIFSGYRMAYLILGFSGLAGAVIVFTVPSRRAYS